MSTDVLSEVLRAVRLTRRRLLRDRRRCALGRGSSAVESHRVARDARRRARHRVPRGRQGLVLRRAVDGPAVKMETGDVIVFPQGDAHIISSAPGLRRPPAGRLGPRSSMKASARSPSRINESGATNAQIVCGFLGCDARPFNPLLAALPRLVHVREEAANRAAWSNRCPARGHGVRSAKARRRRHARAPERAPLHRGRAPSARDPASETTGWLAGLRDEAIGRTLSVLHDRPAQPWSLDDLAKEAGLSRSVLAERFHHFVGTPPMQYLAQWRMQLAASLLSGTNVTIAQIAERVGYGSEAALSRAFKRLVGVAPSAWREGVRPSAAFTPPGYEADDSAL